MSLRLSVMRLCHCNKHKFYGERLVQSALLRDICIEEPAKATYVEKL